MALLAIEVSFENEFSEQLILDCFEKVKDTFSCSFSIKFLSKKGKEKLFEMKTELPSDFYAAGLVGANIEVQMQKALSSISSS